MTKEASEEIIEKLKQGDSSALEKIYTENRDAFIRFAARYDLAQSEVIDVYQDAILAFRDNVMFGKVDQLNSSIKTYLFSIGKYMIYKRLKNETDITLDFLDVNRLELYVEPLFDRDDTVNKQKAIVNRYFNRMGERCKTLLRLFYYEGLTLKEIQTHLGYDNYNVVKSQKSRCLKNLKDLINKHDD